MDFLESSKGSPKVFRGLYAPRKFMGFVRDFKGHRSFERKFYRFTEAKHRFLRGFIDTSRGLHTFFVGVVQGLSRAS